ncbi:thioredoxin-disulfide reductase [Winkia sp. UMB3158]|uniref:thioredoxin-disulfide reductase n=1 Tax=unclassified Winkia TaxID=2692119 RepID=UPI0025538628|nr:MULTISPECIES: thioredoxin-disulfide reductase [unclassified Winkia]MDK7148908.1 thioredoxin-disulfide reductase [Winkia sp. UMB3158]MDK7905863.1 thioredoxin-disulfide reductase [Winkia sp. UMB0889B]MDK8340356.1 thioredoxin-disulfide reductase [Winkia sp. UMB3164B]MDK8564911.1 thioredoxin-disulfide reductase [Winkia sp. UMB3164A]
MAETVHDVIIVGSGPAGYTAAIYTARAGLNPVMIAGSVTAGGALMQTTDVENYPGFQDGILGPDLMEQMRVQAERFGADIRLEDAEELVLSGDVKKVVTNEGEYLAKTVIVSTGSEYRKLGVPGEEEFSGRGVSYCATCDGFFFKDKPIVVVGGGDSAMEEATFLAKFGSSVTVVHRRDQLRASQAMQDRAKANDKINFVWNSVVTQVNGQQGATSVTLHNRETGEDSELEAAGIFVAIGQIPRTELVEGQLELGQEGYINVASPSQATNIPGVFACGDVADPRYQQAVTAAGSGCRAALDVEHYLEQL